MSQCDTTNKAINDIKDNINLIIADRDIKKGEELTANYTKQPYLEQPEKDWE